MKRNKFQHPYTGNTGKEAAVVVDDVLILPSFSSSQVIAGNNGLDREVTSAMVLEAADIENWGKRGQLIISSFYALEHLTPAEIARFFTTMNSIGIAAVAFKPERLLPEAPKQIIDLCNDFDIPLIELAADVKYESILMDVMGHILDSNLTLLNRFYEVHKHLMALALKQPSIPYILSTLKNTLHLDVTYLDTMRDRKFSTDNERASFSGYSFQRCDPSPYQTHAYFSARLFYDKGYGSKSGATISENALAVRIPSSDDVDYYILIHNEGKTLSPLDSMTVENVVSLLQMEILKQNAIKQKVFFQNNNAVHDLLLGRYPTQGKIDSTLTMLGIEQYPFYEVLLIHIDVEDPTDIDRQDEIHQAIRRKFRTLYPGMVYFVNGDRAVYLHNFRSPLTSIDVEAIQDALEDLHSRSTLPLFTHIGVLSGSHDRYTIDKGNREALDAYRLFEGAGSKNRCFRYDDLGVYKLMLAVDNPSLLSSCIDPRIAKLSNDQPELFETLICLCDNGLDYNKTASVLFVHPKTVRYRIERVRTITGIDVKNPDDYLQIIFAEKIMRITSGRS